MTSTTLNTERIGWQGKLCFPSFNYIGSKMKLLDYIKSSIEDYTKKTYDEVNGFADICSGTGVVAYDILKNGCNNILTNDIQHYAYTISSIWSIKDINVEKIKNIIVKMNIKYKDVKLEECVSSQLDFIYNNYTEAGPDKRMYLSMKNGYIVDKIRQEIAQLLLENKITKNENNLLIKILLYAVVGVSNIASVYGAYLKKYKKCALKDLILNEKLIDSLVTNENINHISKNLDINELLDTDDLSRYEVVYIDPPYVSRGYHDNYHLLETISKYDYPIIRGKTGLRESNTKSKFCSKRDALVEFKNVLKKIKSKYVFISYSSDSIVSREKMIEIMTDAEWDDIMCYTKEYKRFKSNRNSEELQEKNITEYIFCGKKN